MQSLAVHEALTEDADIHTASDEYAARFGGVAGRWMLEVQTSILLSLLPLDKTKKVVDVGGGHAQTALPLLQAGYPVTVVGSEKAALFQIEKHLHQKGLQTETGNLLALPFADQSFDVVLCFRLLPHCDRYPELIRELCRVAKDQIIVDYPTDESLNSLTPLLFGFKKNVEKNTRPYTLFKNADIRKEFEKHGFRVEQARKQFFVPMVVHRLLKNRHVSSALEFLPRIFGLTKLFGSPVILSCKRNDC